MRCPEAQCFAEVKMSVQSSASRPHSAVKPKDILQNKIPKG